MNSLELYARHLARAAERSSHEEVRERQKLYVLDEVKLRDLLLEVVRIVDSPDELDLRAAHCREARVCAPASTRLDAAS